MCTTETPARLTPSETGNFSCELIKNQSRVQWPDYVLFPYSVFAAPFTIFRSWTAGRM